jgi:ornithine carbamoyltransferase
MKRDFLSLADWSREELEAIFALTKDLKAKQKRAEPHRLLEGKSVALIFEKSSTRTRVSFEVGVGQLGGQPLFIASGTSQMGRGEPIKDTARTLSRYCDAVMIRTYGQEIVEEFARYASVPVINGLTDKFHPCQVMADLFTVIEHKGGYEAQLPGWRRQQHGQLWIEAAPSSASSSPACPQGYEPDLHVWEGPKPGRPRLPSRRTGGRVAGADVLNTDVWASMGQEAEQKQREYACRILPGREACRPGKPRLHRHALPAGAPW